MIAHRSASASSHVHLVQRVCRFIDEQLPEPLTLAALAAHAGLSPFHLQRIFKRVMGVSPREYADARRLDHFKRGLRAGQDVTTALYDAGYGSASRIYERAPTRLGMTPAAYGRGGLGMAIGYTIVDGAAASLGRLLVAATPRGVCAVMMGPSEAALTVRLRSEYPAAQIHRAQPDDGAAAGPWVRALKAHLEGAEPHLDLPLDVRATAFQCRVWALLRAIPYGQTRSYGQIARALGQPKAARAVARACATNPVAIAIPCHRVVRENGELGGYRWGRQRKQALLEHERTQAPEGRPMRQPRA